ncbi:MAG: Ig-like domain-containing protein, partial [Bacteroidales bacterium]|nr:Ig-like domain-containing protein [Bacteroidales bacterium]
MKHLKLLLAMILVAGVTVFIGCSDDDEPAEMTIETITGTGTDLESGDQVTKDLNAASAATDVPLDVVIEITFSKEVDAATVTSSTVTLSSSSGDVGLGLDVSGTTITVTPDGELERG